jgi:hypothetical protein
MGGYLIFPGTGDIRVPRALDSRTGHRCPEPTHEMLLTRTKLSDAEGLWRGSRRTGAAGGAVARPDRRRRPTKLLEAAFKGVLALDPENAQARHNLGVLYRKTGRHIEGVIDPNDPRA